MSQDRPHNQQAPHTTPQSQGPWSEETLGNAIGALKDKGASEALRDFLAERIEELTREHGPETILARLHNELGLCHLYEEEMESARTHFEKAVTLNPDNHNAAYNRANLSFYTSDLDGALEQYEHLLEKAPDHTGATYNAALCHALTGRVTEALPLFQRVVTLDPSYAGAHFWAGECLLHQGTPNDALPYFQNAWELNPDHPDSSRGLAICLFHAKQHEKAIRLCENMLEAFGPELMALRIKGDALLELGRPKEAAQAHIDMAHIDFDAREFLVNRAKHLLEAEPDKAPPYIACVLDHFPDFKGALDPEGSVIDTSASQQVTL